VSTLETAGALAATAALAGGITELGRRLGGESAAARWVRGWTALWWLVAVTAQLIGPAIAAVVGSLVVAAAFAAWGYRERHAARPWLVGGAAVLAGAPLYLCPPVFYDALVYHLGLPWSWLVNGSFDPIEHHVFSHFPIAGQSVFLIPVSWGLPEAAAGLHWICLAASFAACVELARRLGAGRWSLLAPLLLAGCWHLLWVAGQPAVDLLVTLALLAAVEALAAGPEPRWLDLGLACGLAAATKYPAAVPVAAVLVAALLFFPGRWRRLGVALAVAASAASFVPIRNLVTTGNPVYPLLWPLLGGSGWTARDDARWSGLVHEGVGGLASLPSGLLRLVEPPGGLGWWVVVAAVLALGAVLGAGRAARSRRLVATTAALGIAGWLVSSQTARYAFPMAALLAVLAAAGASRLPRRAGIAVAVAVAATLALGLNDLGRFTLGRLQIHRMWSGEVSRDEWRHQLTINDPLPAYRAADAELHGSARLVVVGEGRSWGCRTPHHVSSSYDLQLVQAWVEAAATADEVARTAAAEGFSHLLVNWGELERLGGNDFQVLRWRSAADERRWQLFLRQWTVPLASFPPCELRAIRAPSSGTNSHPLPTRG
jgi:hypothetical protein